MENSAQELQELANAINPNATQTVSEPSAQSAETPAQEERSMKDTVFHYAKTSTEKLFGWSGDLLVGTGITTGLAVLGIFILAQLNVGLLAGLAIIIGVGLVCKYVSGIAGGRGFNPLTNFATAQ